MPRTNINPELPLRSKTTGRRVYVVCREWLGPDADTIWIDLREGYGRRGFRYYLSGEPRDGCPLGEIENFEPDNNPFSGPIVDTEMQAFASNNPDWGMF